MSAAAKLFLAKVLYRLVHRRSPRMELAAGTPLAALLGVLLSLWLEPATAAAIAAPAGALVTTIVNLIAAEGPPGENP
jgi:hypothetical protein